MEKSENKPSTSTGQSAETPNQAQDDEIKQLCEAWGEKLEEKSVPLNLTSMNVKSIVHHFCKYPSTFDALMGIRQDANFPNMRITRSQRKTGENPSGENLEENEGERAIVFESLYQNRPNTFLDLDFDDNDEYDEDYSANIEENDEFDEPIDDEEEEEEEDDDNGEEEPSGTEVLDPFEQMDIEEMHRKEIEDAENPSSSHFENLNDSLVRPESCLIPHIDNSYEKDEFRSYVNPEYRDFINAVNRSGMNIETLPDDDPDDDPDDEDYDIQADGLAFDVDDWDETRRDRTTEISRVEVERLMIDTILAEKEIPANAFPKEAMQQAKEVPNETPSKKSQKEKDAEAMRRLRMQSFSNESCSLIAKNGQRVTFRESEINLLKLQLEQHVQLLTQTVVTCYCDDSLSDSKNTAQLMINELESFYSSRGNDSIFNIPNLGYSIETCHDIIGMKQVEKDSIKWAKIREGDIIRPEAVAVLARSHAIKYPHLLPIVQPERTSTTIPFLKSENLMLAMGLMQFAHLPRKKTKIEQLDRYHAIHQHCLPSRSADTIRNRMKTVRASRNPEIHKIILQAEEGTLKLEHSPPLAIAFEGSIQKWPEENWPVWYQLFTRVFKEVGVDQVVPKGLEDQDHQESIVVIPMVDGANADLEYISLGTIDESGRKVVMKKDDVAELVNSLYPKDSPSKRRKMATPVKISSSDSIRIDSDRDSPVSMTIDEGEGNDGSIDHDNSMTCFTNPATPGKRPPSENSYFEILDDFDCGFSVSSSNSRTWIPRTPRYDPEESCSRQFPTDFGSFMDNQQKCMTVPDPYRAVDRKRRLDEMETIEEESDVEGLRRSDDLEKEVMDNQLDLEDTDAPTSDDEERPTKRTKIRSRSEKEELGIAGMGDLEYRSVQEKSLGKKLLKDVGNRLFMHHEKWKQLREILGNDDLDDKEKVKKVCVLFEKMPEIVEILLVFAPESALSRDLLRDQSRIAMKHAMEVLMDVDAYFSANRIKSSKFIFKQMGKVGREDLEVEEPLSIQKMNWDKMDSVEAAEMMYGILGQHRPLWAKVEKMFYSLAWQEKCNPEDFEYIDLTEPIPHGSHQFEVIDDIDQVLNPVEKKEIEKTRGDLVVRTGQLFASTKAGFVPVEVTAMKWNKAWDMKLLKAYNRAVVEDPDFKIEQIAEKAEDLPFGVDAIQKRMNYLLDLINKKL